VGGVEVNRQQVSLLGKAHKELFAVRGSIFEAVQGGSITAHANRKDYSRASVVNLTGYVGCGQNRSSFGTLTFSERKRL